MDLAIKEEKIPSGGIADFIYTDEELQTLENQEVEQEFGKGGIAQFKEVGKKIATYGRYGDDTVAHLETGELIVPRALIENNPELKESIFSHLKELGVEDPERYVVGTKKNSINPDTGLPEFFLKKLFKSVSKGISSIGKGVSRALSGVGKALKKVAPIVLPMVLAATPLGPIYGAALGSGISTLMQGGDLGDAVKSAALAGGVGAIYSGASSAMAGKGFGAGISADLANPGARFDQLSLTDPFKSFQPTASKVDIQKLDPIKTADIDVTVGKDNFGEFDPLIPKGGKQLPKPKGTLDTVSDYMFRGGKSKSEIIAAQDLAEQKYLANAKAKGFAPTEAGIKAARADAGPGFLTKFGPTAGLAGLALYAGGAFDAPEQDKLNIPISGMELFKQNPDLYRIANLTPRRATRKDETEKERDFIYEPYRFKDPSIFYARQGGLAALGSTINQKLQEPAGMKAQEIPSFLKEVETMTEAKFGIDIPSLGERPLGLGMPQIPREITNPSLGGIRLGSSGPATTILEGLPKSDFGDVFQAYMPIDQGEGIDQFGKPMPTNEQTGPAMTDDERLNMLKSAFGQGVSQSSAGAFGGGGARQSGLQNFITGIGALGLADGGDVFPRRNGGIGPNEGTPGKDSVRAMLMPGEFVMTTDAVRGLGNGDLNTGIKNMYSVMSKLEKKGKAMA
jgi:hypothetical protein